MIGRSLIHHGELMSSEVTSKTTRSMSIKKHKVLIAIDELNKSTQETKMAISYNQQQSAIVYHLILYSDVLIITQKEK